MNIVIYKVVLRICLLVLATAIGSFSQGCGKSTDPDKPLVNKVTMSQDFEVTGGDEFSVPVYFENSQPIAALSLPLRYPSSLMRCDSVSFVGGRCEKFFLNRYYTRLDTIQVGAIDTVGVGTGSGLCVTLHFWVFGNAPDTTVSIELLVNPTLPFGYADTSLTAEAIIPLFEAGRIRIISQL